VMRFTGATAGRQEMLRAKVRDTWAADVRARAKGDTELACCLPVAGAACRLPLGVSIRAFRRALGCQVHHEKALTDAFALALKAEGAA
jgi:hypothetical protein